jgi:hypothetical protein
VEKTIPYTELIGERIKLTLHGIYFMKVRSPTLFSIKKLLITQNLSLEQITDSK